MKKSWDFVVGTLLAGASVAVAIAGEGPSDSSLARGRYIVVIGGCNDCHTSGYALSAGKVPEREWLKGDTLGWQGPWGTTYPSNLRLYMQRIDEDRWVQTAKKLQTRPPMPWFSLNQMADADLRALYRYVRNLGAAGDPAPEALPPGQIPKGPVIAFPAPPK